MERGPTARRSGLRALAPGVRRRSSPQSIEVDQCRREQRLLGQENDRAGRRGSCRPPSRSVAMWCWQVTACRRMQPSVRVRAPSAASMRCARSAWDAEMPCAGASGGGLHARQLPGAYRASRPRDLRMRPRAVSMHRRPDRRTAARPYSRWRHGPSGHGAAEGHDIAQHPARSECALAGCLFVRGGATNEAALPLSHPAPRTSRRRRA